MKKLPALSHIQAKSEMVLASVPLNGSQKEIYSLRPL